MVPLVFDRALVRARLARAIQQGAADFLLRRAADDLDERLGAVVRNFPRALDLATPDPDVAERLARSAQIGTLIRAAPLPEQRRRAFLTVCADAEALPLAAASFDLVVSILALHQINDLPGCLVQIRQALRPDGLFLACLAGGQTLAELRSVLAQAEVEVAGGASPRVAPFADVRELGALLQRAGFALPVTDADKIVVRYPGLFALARDLRSMGATNALQARRRVPLRRAVLMRAAEIYAERFADSDGRIRATFEFVWLSGWAPAAGQPKPLRPGSAKKSLAEALRDIHGRSEKGGE